MVCPKKYLSRRKTVQGWRFAVATWQFTVRRRVRLHRKVSFRAPLRQKVIDTKTGTASPSFRTVNR